MSGLRACILLALACAAYGGYVSPYVGFGYNYGYAPYTTYGAAPYGLYRAPVVYHGAPVKYVASTVHHPVAVTGVSKVATTYTVPTATKVVSAYTHPTVTHVPTYYGYGVSPYGYSYGYGLGGYHYLPVLKKSWTMSTAKPAPKGHTRAVQMSVEHRMGSATPTVQQPQPVNGEGQVTVPRSDAVAVHVDLKGSTDSGLSGGTKQERGR
ncbi:uncharacterized protein LOC144148645 [Haemaphysalis longicornis]